jgi:hypothetical protein
MVGHRTLAGGTNRAKLCAPGGNAIRMIVTELPQLRAQVAAAHRAYHTLHDALTALPHDHPAAGGLAALVAVAARHWHEARLALDAARHDPSGDDQPPERQ